jgi:hypothetical protein
MLNKLPLPLVRVCAVRLVAEIFQRLPHSDSQIRGAAYDVRCFPRKYAHSTHCGKVALARFLAHAVLIFPYFNGFVLTSSDENGIIQPCMFVCAFDFVWLSPQKQRRNRARMASRDAQDRARWIKQPYSDSHVEAGRNSLRHMSHVIA